MTGIHLDFIGAPGEIRTPDLLVRSQTLYPTELRAHYSFSNWRRGRDYSSLRSSPFGPPPLRGRVPCAGFAGSGSNPLSWWLRTRQSRSFDRYPFGASLERWRRGRDSNPRRAFNPYSLSRGALSTTQPPLRTLYSGRSSVVLSYRRSGLLVASGSSPFGPASLRDAVGFDACGISRSNPRRAFNPYSLSRGALMRRALPSVLRTGPASRSVQSRRRRSCRPLSHLSVTFPKPM